MRVDLEWCISPRGRRSCQLVGLKDRHLWETLHSQAKQLTAQDSQLRHFKKREIGPVLSASA